MSTETSTEIFNLQQLSANIDKVKAAKEKLMEEETSMARCSAMAGATSLAYGLMGGPAIAIGAFLISLAANAGAIYYDNLVTTIRKMQWAMEDSEDIIQGNPNYDLVNLEITYKLVDGTGTATIAVPIDFKLLGIHTTKGGWILPS